MNVAEKFKTLMDTGEFDFINEIPKENLWKLLFLVAFTYNEIKKEGDKNGCCYKFNEIRSLSK